MNDNTLLIIEDEVDILELLEYTLQKEGFEIDFSKKNPVVVNYEAKLVKHA